MRPLFTGFALAFPPLGISVHISLTFSKTMFMWTITQGLDHKSLTRIGVETRVGVETRIGVETIMTQLKKRLKLDF